MHREQCRCHAKAYSFHDYTAANQSFMVWKYFLQVLHWLSSLASLFLCPTLRRMLHRNHDIREGAWQWYLYELSLCGLAFYKNTLLQWIHHIMDNGTVLLRNSYCYSTKSSTWYAGNRSSDRYGVFDSDEYRAHLRRILLGAHRQERIHWHKGRGTRSSKHAKSSQSDYSTCNSTKNTKQSRCDGGFTRYAWWMNCDCWWREQCRVLFSDIKGFTKFCSDPGNGRV